MSNDVHGDVDSQQEPERGTEDDQVGKQADYDGYHLDYHLVMTIICPLVLCRLVLQIPYLDDHADVGHEKERWKQVNEQLFLVFTHEEHDGCARHDYCHADYVEYVVRTRVRNHVSDGHDETPNACDRPDLVLGKHLVDSELPELGLQFFVIRPK